MSSLRRGVPSVVFLVLILNELLDTFAQFCFKKTAMAADGVTINNVSSAFHFLSIAVRQGYIWLGLLALGIALLSWTGVLAKIDLSVATPLTSTSYIFVALTSLIFLHEHISLLRWSGILLILIGVAVVSFSSEQGGKAEL